MHITCDLDGVVFDFENAWVRCAQQVLGKSLTRHSQRYDLHHAYAISGQQKEKVWAAFHLSGCWRTVPALPNARETLIMMQDLGHRLSFVSQLTVQDPELRRQIEDDRQASLERLGLRGDMVFVEGEKYHALTHLRPHFYADDRWPCCLDARHAHVPFIAHIQSQHDGDGTQVDGVQSYPDLANAVGAFRPVLSTTHPTIRGLSQEIAHES